MRRLNAALLWTKMKQAIGTMFLAPALALVLYSQATAPGIEDSASILRRLQDSKEIDPSDLYNLQFRPAGLETLAILREAFAARAEKTQKQRIAMTLIRLGDKSPEYYDYLASYAGAAIADPAPYFAAIDASGKPIPGKLNPAFENWCAENGKEPRAEVEKQYNYLDDVNLFAQSQDRRAIGLLRKGLDAHNPGIVTFAVEGLGRLQDLDSLPLIETAAARFSSTPLVVAMGLPWFQAPQANALLERLIPSATTREGVIRDARRLREMELIRSSRTAGDGPRKER